MCDTCGDNRFEIIDTYKRKLIEATNIESSPEEMAVIDNILFRFWQMGWLASAQPDWNYNSENHEITLVVPPDVYESTKTIFLSVGYEGSPGLRGMIFSKGLGRTGNDAERKQDEEV